MSKEEILKRKEELRQLLNEAKTEEEINEIEKEAKKLEEIEEKQKEDITKEEERQLLTKSTLSQLKKDTENLEKRSLKVREDGEPMEKEQKRTLAQVLESPEYRTAWAKKLMGRPEKDFTEEEKRALGDAITTTDTEFVASAAETQGINNGGLFIPKSVRSDIMEIITDSSPIYRDVRKLNVAGNIELPYLDEADDAEWYTELKETKNEGQKYGNLQLTGWELAKDVEITWKLEQMAVDSFIPFIVEELAAKMGIALVNAIIYGDGVNKPRGITKDLTAIKEGETPVDRIIATYKSLSKEARRGAKTYISTNVNIDICGYKDNNGNYPFLQGLATNKLTPVEVDPYLKDDDIISGNMRNYILNEVTPVRVDKESKIKPRRIVYGGYAIYDGVARPEYFAYSQKSK
ncbi:MAG: hypothetical protein BHV96_05540 [Clostridium sp. CAG:354_28_25]|jgi:HK97 family phage major capsid protein|nr:MAG: hypothetical protein BHV96_05540 [Clostridium sp. CAG:354_28_25]